jgi:hypothetical protein
LPDADPPDDDPPDDDPPDPGELVADGAAVVAEDDDLLDEPHPANTTNATPNATAAKRRGTALPLFTSIPFGIPFFGTVSISNLPPLPGAEQRIELTRVIVCTGSTFPPLLTLGDGSAGNSGWT